MLVDAPGEFHPQAFCVWKKAGLDPWETLRWVNGQLRLEEMPAKPRPLCGTSSGTSAGRYEP